MSQVFVLNSAYGLMTAVAAIDSGRIAAAPSGRILVAVNAAIIPEAAESIADAPHLASLRDRFDRVVSLNDLVAPERPAHWRPRPSDAPVIERLLRQAWDLGAGPVDLFLQSPQVAPSRVFVDLFPGSSLTVVGDGLMTYSPIRNRWPRKVLDRVVGVTYADTVAGVSPLLFSESGAPRIPVGVEALRAVVAEVAESTRDPRIDALAAMERPALVLGQYLAALGLVSAAEEQAMQEQMIDRALEWSPSAVVFKPHPSAEPAMIEGLRRHARSRGVDFTVYPGAAPAEVLATRMPLVGSVAGFSTALPTLQALGGSPIAAVGTEILLGRLTPYENGNRIPVTIIDALTRRDSPYAEPGAMQQLVDAVGYAMQPRIVEHLRPRAEEFLAAAPGAERARYFSAARVGSLALPGGTPPRLAERLLAPVGGAGRLAEAQLAIRGARRRTTRAWKALRGG
ncbi:MULTISPECIES: polysialyltransferase family glycosyltransferase [unclassified Microbacterium]|uniref:polysialyltransferase family glycosyltransferase n=1 Tax=unclassified Microbacterium TaxID=2609290 RepID=UPI003867A2D8